MSDEIHDADDLNGMLPDEIIAVVRRLTAERDAAVRRAEAAEAANARLIGALRITGGVGRLAQCPVCLAERTNGERHDDVCAILARGQQMEGKCES